MYCFTGAEYKLRFRHTLEPEIDQIPNKCDNDSQKFTLDELRAAGQMFDITRMSIDGNIPSSLHEITPHLKHLELRNIPHRDQLKR